MLSRLKEMGPGVLVAAAFIGPGTVTACTVAGANFGYVLIWTLVFATVSTMILQEMSARLGTISQAGLGEVLAKQFAGSAFKIPIFALITMAIFVGNAAYEGGNLTGAALGVQAIFGNSDTVFMFSITALAALSVLVLYKGNYQQIEKTLIALVCLMGAAFILTFFVVQPDLLSMIQGAFLPVVPEGGLLTVLALIGTTIVPYNLFLHASSAKQKYSGEQQLKSAQIDTAVSIGVGGLVAIFIVSTSAASLFSAGIEVNSAVDMAVQIEPLFGDFSQWLIGFGLVSAGLSSAITAPLATGYAIAGLLNLTEKKRELLTKQISLLVAIVGTVIALLGIKPVKLILMAQFSNGLLLPIIACFLLYVMNNKAILGRHTNGIISNSLGCAVVLFTLILGMRLIGLSTGLL